jgi:hypothetical protein
MPIAPANPFPKSPGDQLRSSDWNQVVNEVIRLDNAKVNRAGDTISGALTVTGNSSTGGNATVTGTLTVSAAMSTAGSHTVSGNAALNGGASVGNIGGARQSTLHIAGGIWDTATSEGDVKIGNATHRLKIGVATGGGGAGDARISAQGGTNRIMMGGGTSDVLSITPTGIGIHDITPALALNVNGDAQIGATNTNTNRLTIYGPFNSGTQDGALVVRRGTSSIYLRIDQNEVDVANGSLFLNYFSLQQVRVGSTTTGAGGMYVYGNFHATGAISAGGGKGGFVVDHFINNSGDALEEGDVVVLRGDSVTTFYGENDTIPVPEVDLTSSAYDRRVCGIVAEVLVEEEPALPTGMQSESGDGDETEEVDVHLDSGQLESARRVGRGVGRGVGRARAARGVVRLTELRSVLEVARSENIPLARARARRDFGDNVRRLQVFRPEELAELDRTKVAAGQVGKMAIMGCYTHCKVDADIAPIEVGDLLTTSPTRGHAQKVTEPQRAIGAIIGKAMGELRSGRGKIPVLVMMQ